MLVAGTYTGRYESGRVRFQPFRCSVIVAQAIHLEGEKRFEIYLSWRRDNHLEDFLRDS